MKTPFTKFKMRLPCGEGMETAHLKISASGASVEIAAEQR